MYPHQPQIVHENAIAYLVYGSQLPLSASAFNLNDDFDFMLLDNQKILESIDTTCIANIIFNGDDNGIKW